MEIQHIPSLVAAAAAAHPLFSKNHGVEFILSFYFQLNIPIHTLSLSAEVSSPPTVICFIEKYIPEERIRFL